MNESKQYQFIAREIIDLALERRDDPSVLESLSEICWSLSRIFEGKQTDIDWHSLYSELDQNYYGLQHDHNFAFKHEVMDHVATQIAVRLATKD